MVDIKCTFPKSKYKRRERTSMSENQDDETLLRQPMSKICEGFREAKTAYENGTDEVRQLLMRECTIIYECTACRNMFRNLSNFICHKRKYCTGWKAEDYHSFADRCSNKFITTDKRSEPYPVKSRTTDSPPNPSTKPLSRDICRVIERLKSFEVSKEIKCRKAPIDDERELCASELKTENLASESKSVKAATQTACQSLNKHYDVASFDLDNISNLLEAKIDAFSSDTKSISPSLTLSDNSKKRSEGINCGESFLQGFSCEICKTHFQTEKLLKIHVDKNHTSRTYVFQCPTCTMTFLQPAAVIRHLANEHRKPLRRVRKIRDAILKKRFQLSDVQSQLSKAKEKCTSSSADHQNEGLVLSCPHCSKMFKKKEALRSHLISCLARNASLNKDDFSEKVKASSQHTDNTRIEMKISDKVLEPKNQSDTICSEDMIPKIKEEPQEDLNVTEEKNSSNINEMFENLENQTFGNGLHTVCLENIEMMVELNENSIEMEKANESKIDEHDSFNRNKSNQIEKTKRFRVIAASKQLTCRCKICNKQFNALSNLRRHISMFHYRSKRFGCNLCDYRAFRRYDIVNHLSFVHKMTGERETMAIEYVTVHEINYSKNDVEGDIVLINEETVANDDSRKNVLHSPPEEKAILSNSFDNGLKSKKTFLISNKDSTISHKRDSVNFKVKSQVKVIRKKFKKSLETQIESKLRPIRNRTKTVNKDFVYDLITNKDQSKQTSRLTIKRSNTCINDQNNMEKVNLRPSPVKIVPYRLRTEPLIPAITSSIKGITEIICRNIIHDGLAAPSTLPELPAERPQMRSRLISASRTDLNTIPIIESSELEAAGLKSTFFDDSFLEKFAKKSNPSFRMKPLLAMQHSPLNSILQKFDASQQNAKIENNLYHKPPTNDYRIPPHYSLCVLESLTIPSLKDKEMTPNTKQTFKPSSPPVAPKKRITLMERLAENRAKRRDSLVTSALEN